MAVPALHDGRKRNSGAHWTLQVRLQILRQHKGGVFTILKMKVIINLSVKDFQEHCRVSDLALSARDVAPCLSVYYQISNLVNKCVKLWMKNCKYQPLAPPLLHDGSP